MSIADAAPTLADLNPDHHRPAAHRGTSKLQRMMSADPSV